MSKSRNTSYSCKASREVQYSFILWDTLKDTEYSITVTDTDSWGVKKEYPVNIHEENSKETEVKQKCQD